MIFFVHRYGRKLGTPNFNLWFEINVYCGYSQFSSTKDNRQQQQ